MLILRPICTALKNIDQVILFFAMLAGLVILALQFVLILVAMVVQTANAADGDGTLSPSNYSELFILDGRENDLALTLLDKVFGIPDFFGTSAPTGTGFHTALHQLLQFYSIGLLVIAAIILLFSLLWQKRHKRVHLLVRGIIMRGHQSDWLLQLVCWCRLAVA